MATFTVEVPPTREQGSYKTTVSDSYGETYRARALWDYNSCRAHDGLPPLTRMPAGTKYTRVRVTADVWEIQGNYGHGWECVTSETTWKEARARLKEYRENEAAPFRVVKKRERIEN